MIKVNIHQAKTHLSKYLNQLSKGDTILLCKRNVPVAEIRAIADAPKKERPIGLAKEIFQVPDCFFEPLSDDILNGFDGRANETDTCTFLWIITDDDRLSKTARDMFRSSDNKVFLSAASAWEIVVKNKLGKLPLPDSPRTFVPMQRQQHGIEPLPVDEDSSLLLSTLPDIHRDPFDRMLICQAIQNGMSILMPDHLIEQYPVPTRW